MLSFRKYSYILKIINFLFGFIIKEKDFVAPIMNEWTDGHRKIYSLILKNKIKLSGLSKTKLALAISTLTQDQISELLEKHITYEKSDKKFDFSVSLSDLKAEMEYFEALIFAYDSRSRFYGANYDAVFDKCPGDFAEGVISRTISDVIYEIEELTLEANEAREKHKELTKKEEPEFMIPKTYETHYKEKFKRLGITTESKLIILMPCLENHVFLGHIYCHIEFESSPDNFDRIARAEFVIPFPARCLFLETTSFKEFKLIELIDFECISNKKIIERLRNELKIVEIVKN